MIGVKIRGTLGDKNPSIRSLLREPEQPEVWLRREGALLRGLPDTTQDIRDFCPQSFARVAATEALDG